MPSGQLLLSAGLCRTCMLDAPPRMFPSCGHPDAERAQRTNEPRSVQEHQARALGAPTDLWPRLPLQVAFQAASGSARSRVPGFEEGDLRTRLLLASASGEDLRARASTEVAAGLLAAQTGSQPAA